MKELKYKNLTINQKINAKACFKYNNGNGYVNLITYNVTLPGSLFKYIS